MCGNWFRWCARWQSHEALGLSVGVACLFRGPRRAHEARQPPRTGPTFSDALRPKRFRNREPYIARIVGLYGWKRPFGPINADDDIGKALPLLGNLGGEVLGGGVGTVATTLVPVSLRARSNLAAGRRGRAPQRVGRRDPVAFVHINMVGDEEPRWVAPENTG